MPKYISIKLDHDRRYEEVSIVVKDNDKWAVVLQETGVALEELEARIETLVQLGDTAGRKGLAVALQGDVATAKQRFEEAHPA